MSDHTPLPWTLDEHGGVFYVWGPDRQMVADNHEEKGYERPVARMRGVGRGASDEELRANGELIVRACNAHRDLVAVLKDCRSETELLAAAIVCPKDNHFSRLLRRIDVALAKAEAR